jgi:hypothetical protein
MAKLGRLTFSSMVVDGKKYRGDILIFAEGPRKEARRRAPYVR